MYSYGRLSRDAGGNRTADLSTRSDDEDEASAPGDEAEVDGFIGYRNCSWKLVAYWVGVVLTGGALGLFTLWWPGMWPALTKKRASMADATSFLVQAQGRYKMAYVQTEWDDVRWFEIQQLRFVYQPEAATYVRLQHYKDLKCVDIPQQAVGIQRDVALHRLRMSGPNAFNIPQDHIVVAWLRGMLSPFHVFILGTCILWYVDDYTVFASVILAVTIISVSLTVWDERRNINRIQKLINQQSVVETLRDGSWLALQSGGLVHGDLITLEDNQVVPADVVIVSGECVVDESQLTGESTPVRKYAITEKEEEDEASPSIYSQAHDIKHTLFSGTRLLKVIPRQGTDRVTAFVYSTGFNTRKGGLIRRILYPNDVVFRYRRHTMLFILALILVAPVSFTVSFVFWDSYDVGTWENILRSLEVITLLVPVTIPIMQMMAQGIAALNLRQYGIFTIAPSRIIMSGKIRMMCFDKTGTLTENGLRMKAVLPTALSVGGRWAESDTEGEKAESSRPGQGRDAGMQFVAAPVLMAALPASHLIKQAMACCHSATNIEGEGLIGHPLDVEMFNASQWRMREGKEGTVFSSSSPSSSSSSSSAAGGSGLELRVVKAFPFVHSLRRMSVIVKSSLDNSISLFTKAHGSPETIRDLALPETVPANLDDTLREHARKGNYILAIGVKFNVLDDEAEAHHVHRKQIDKDLVFLGLLIFQNEVREDSADVIARLKQGDIRNIIITGDGPYTALAVARECGMIDLGSTVALGHTGQDGTTLGSKTAAPQYGVQWVNVDTGREMGQDWVDAHESAKYVAFGDGHFVHKRRSTLSLFDRVRWWNGARRQRDRRLNFTASDALDSALLAADVAGGVDMESPLAGSAEERPSEFILTGTAFDYLKTSEPHLLGKLLFDVRIFARFSPEQKAEVVNLINSTGLVTGMCGDGGNDCGALRAAHAGIAVGGGGVEASVVSPFTSSLASIRCTEILIREGRGALANSLAAFKLLVLIYVVILHTVILLLYYHGSDMSDGMYIYQDLLLVFPLSLFILYPNSATKLARQRPSASLLNSTVIASLLGQSGIAIAFIVGARQLLYAQDWYVPFDPVANGASARSDYWKSHETTALWVFCNFQYIAAAIAFAIGRPFRKEIWHNYLLSLNVLGSLAAASWVLLLPPEWLRDVLYLEDLKTDFKIKLYFMALGCMVTQVLYEAFITMGPFAWVMRRISRWLNLRKKHRLRTNDDFAAITAQLYGNP